MGRSASVILAVAGCLCSGVALAQDAQPQGTPPASAPNDPAAAMIGTWELSDADHDKVCRFVFRNDAALGGHKLEIDKSCPGLFPSTKDVAGWALDHYGNLHLLDARGNAVLELNEVESGIYDGFQPEEGRFILQNAAAAPVRTAEEMVGEWSIARGTGKPICTLTLANTTAGSDSYPLKIKPGCDALVTRFGPTSWRMDSGDLLLLSPRGQSWRFEENDAKTWQRVPETADPVLLVRQ
jgi:hypothetical protein